jgi:hypothetical protein
MLTLTFFNVNNFIFLHFKIEDSSMFDDDSKDNRSKAKEALLEWVRKKTTGYVLYYYHLTFSFFANIFIKI